MNQPADTKTPTLYEQLEERTAQFQAALPAHIPVERFSRILLTAVQNSPALAFADRRSFFNSAMKCAQDGLLPDGREAALVIYKTKKKEGNREFWIDAVQYMPMVGGLRKKVRNSGEIATWDVKAVYEKDEFLYEEGIDIVLKHKPFIDGPAGKLKAVYSVAKLKSGEVSIDVMPLWQVERIRNLSKAKDSGPWKDHYDEMAKKTVARRHSKTLPMSTDLDDLIRRDDDLYDMKGASDAEKLPQARRPQLSDFSELPSSGITEKPAEEASENVDPESGEITEADTAQAAEDEKPADEGGAATLAYGRGRVSRQKGASFRAVPGEYRDQPQATEDWRKGWQDEDRAIHEGNA
jgi:recombination protein RecT